MLLARATAEQCRWTAADAIMGMPYAAEEITDTPAVHAAPVARRLTVAELDAPAAARCRRAAEHGHPRAAAAHVRAVE
jgi:hypothetical protein